jgi:acetyltransferase-like isoleucine patch superfamily enzyme
MVKSVFQKQMSRYGRDYQIDDAIPNSFFRRILRQRFFMLWRGMLFYGKKVFLGRGVRLLNKKNIHLGRSASIGSYTLIDGYAKNKVQIGENSKIGPYSEVRCTSHFSKYGTGFSLGSNSGIGKFAFFGAAGGITIGDNVIMGEYVSFHSENHNFSDTSRLIKEQGVTSKGITLGNDIWVGAKVTFLDGAQVGNHCVVAAGAVVRGTFPDNVVIGGVPAKVIKEL